MAGFAFTCPAHAEVEIACPAAHWEFAVAGNPAKAVVSMVPEHCPTLPPETSGPVGGQTAETNQGGLED
jgi:hypothetical protein